MKLFLQQKKKGKRGKNIQLASVVSLLYAISHLCFRFVKYAVKHIFIYMPCRLSFTFLSFIKEKQYRSFIYACSFKITIHLFSSSLNPLTTQMQFIKLVATARTVNKEQLSGTDYISCVLPLDVKVVNMEGKQ